MKRLTYPKKKNSKSTSLLTPLFLEEMHVLATENKEGLPHLPFAASRGLVTVVKALLDTRAEPNVNRRSGGPSSATALELAVQHNRSDVVSVLIKAKADLNARNPENGLTPLQQALPRGNRFTIASLLEAKASINAAPPTPAFLKEMQELLRLTENGIYSPNFYFAASKGLVTVVTAFLEAKADVNLRGRSSQLSYECTALDFAVHGNQSAPVVSLLIAAGAELNPSKSSSDPLHRTAPHPLYETLRCGNFALMTLLLETKVHVNTKVERGSALAAFVRKSGRRELRQMGDPDFKLGDSQLACVTQLLAAKVNVYANLDRQSLEAFKKTASSKVAKEIGRIVEEAWREPLILAFLCGLHARAGIGSPLRISSQISPARMGSLFDPQVLRLPLRLAGYPPKRLNFSAVPNIILPKQYPAPSG